MYALLIRPRAEKNFAKLPQKLQQKVLKALKKLAYNPFQDELDVKKLIDTQRSYRLRIGELRALYELNTKRKEIVITDLDFRRSTTY